MTVNNKPSQRVAVVRNYTTTEQWGKDMITSIHKLVLDSSSNALIDDFCVIEGGPLPDATQFDVVILTGGVYDLTIEDVEPWVADTISWIQRTVALPDAPKLLGLCWGHQVIARALGGHVETRSDGYYVSSARKPASVNSYRAILRLTHICNRLDSKRSL